jgi:hypothetical protein
MNMKKLTKLMLIIFTLTGLVACGSSSEIVEIQANYEAGNLTLEQRDAAITAQRKREQAQREEQQAEEARRRAANIRIL